jgi:uncharacterized protein
MPPRADSIDDLTVGTAALSRELGATQQYVRRARFGELRVVDTVVAEGTPVDIDVTLESVPGGIAMTGSVTVPWSAPCRRCTTDVDGTLSIELDELFASDHVEGDTYPLGHNEIDLAPAIRDSVLLDLPPGPLCADDCQGPDPAEFPISPASIPASPEDPGEEPVRPIDPRWAALDVLKDPDES